MSIAYNYARQPQLFKLKQLHVLAGILMVLIVAIPLLAGSTTQQRGGDEICETLPSEIHLIKGEWYIKLLFEIILDMIWYRFRGIRWTRTTAANLQRWGSGEQVWRIVQQPGAAFGHNANWISEGVLLLPGEFSARSNGDADTLLWSGWWQIDRCRCCLNGHPIEGAGWVQMLKVRWLF